MMGPSGPGRPTKGAVAQASSDSLLFAHLASRLEGVLDRRRLDGWGVQLGIEPTGEAIRRKPAKAARLEGREVDAVLRPWVSVDWWSLGYFVALVAIRWATIDRDIGRIETVPGVVDILVADDTERLFVKVVYERLPEKRALRVRLGEFCEIDSWVEIAGHRPSATISTVRRLALTAAEREHLLRSD